MLQKEEIDFLYLLNCGTRKNYDNKDIIDTFNLQKVYRVAVHSGLSAYVNDVLEKSGIRNEKFLYSRDRIIAYQIQLDLQVNLLDSLLKKNNIRYFPLKGAVIKNCYPGFALREMGDVDVLIDKNNRNKIKKLLLNNGFKSSDDHLSGYHDAYKNYQFELEAHYQLINGGLNSFWNKFGKEAINNAKNIAGTACYELSLEDQYIYIFMHAYKHYVLQGLGLRFLLDVFYYRQKYLEQMNLEYIENTLRKLDLLEFEKEIIRLIDLLFTCNLRDVELDDRTENYIENLIGSGAVQGALRDGQIISDLNEVAGKSFYQIFLYSLKKLDSNDKWYAFHNQFAYKHRWFRPMYLFYISCKKFISDPLYLLSRYGEK